ncbi:MAG TPA: hypothetical protein DHU69_01965 [Deltaproteobacteria bacterium]|nr:MAG: hypothetical protein A2056_00480 [Deltaproteobacteria bacterium GWA2_42_85]OGP39775.1 MAG: hypothetical protein A2090_04580 [Deltaproteobacteria bacterium GWD2_42_10]OGP47988.1 MAG: hypothetical protein A2022_02910 [Deltaproteobacteria bacterium GWF2_42_12]OGQ65542.1 MAG: hypothetical protein A3F88_08590 [Deltaproteobacteria bacterium RIFCSPLOWO2_12_FULL_42_16]OGQ72495.1 MAG: hypothetical protein A2235_09450 [Deltaproteobacteria bacterium RIFOXYA2_FULL_42_10]HAG52124.1 hypothetical pro
MEQERLALLRAEIDAQLKEIESIYGKLEERKRKRGKAAVESLGYQLHNLYCAFEDLFKIVAATFENHIEDKNRYHLELLKRMAIPIEGVRPALLSQKNYTLLDNLRSFRHFFRHAYSYELDERKVRIVLEDAVKLSELYEIDVKSFLDSL